MWIVDKKRLETQDQDQPFVKILMNSEIIEFKCFKKYKSEFEERIKEKHTEVIPQYFLKSTLLKVLDTNTHDIAFLFLANKKGNNLSVAVIGRDSAGKFIYDNIYKSKKIPIFKEKKLEKKDLVGDESRLANYKRRMQSDEGEDSFYDNRDKGVIHEKEKFIAFLEDVRSNYVKMFFGVEIKSNDEKKTVYKFQNVMLLDADIDLQNVEDDAKFVFDRGSGCCPEQ